MSAGEGEGSALSSPQQPRLGCCWSALQRGSVLDVLLQTLLFSPNFKGAPPPQCRSADLFI
jgi:hypothetical protein